MQQMRENYRKAMTDFEAASRAREVASKLSADIEHQRAVEAEQQLRRTAAERDTIEITRQRERSSSNARTNDAEARSAAATAENQRYLAEMQLLKAQMAASTEALKAKDAEVQRARAEATALEQARLAAERRAADAESSRSTFPSPPQTFFMQQPPTSPIGSIPTSTENSLPNKAPNLTKLFKIDKFSSKESYQGLGADFDSWLDRFYDSLDDEARGFVLAQEKSWRAVAPPGETYSFSHLVNHLRQAYSTHLDTDQLMAKMRMEKRYAHTWNQHVQYLRHIQKQIGASNRLVLEMFTKYACAEFKTNLVAGVNRANKDDPTELDKAVETLVQLTGTGVNYGKKGRTTASGNTNMASGSSPNNGSRSGNKTSNSRNSGGRGRGDRRGGRSGGRSSSKRPCYVCGQDGHFTTQCPLVVEAKSKASGTAAIATQKTTAVAAAATSPPQNQTQLRSSFGGFVTPDADWQPAWGQDAPTNLAMGDAHHTNQHDPQLQK
ncbi:hypothetical protein LEN26_017696 [Aphanomyces euteiches]|nr:hypothetical protein LEN26_017696 [Aphanomyces euteiches]